MSEWAWQAAHMLETLQDRSDRQDDANAEGGNLRSLPSTICPHAPRLHSPPMLLPAPRAYFFTHKLLSQFRSRSENERTNERPPLCSRA